MLAGNNIDFVAGTNIPLVLDGHNEQQTSAPYFDWIFLYVPIGICDILGSIMIAIIIYRIWSYFGLQGFKTFIRLFLFLISSLIQTTLLISFRLYIQTLDNQEFEAVQNWVACINAGAGPCKIKYVVNFGYWCTTQVVTSVLGLWYGISFMLSRESIDVWTYMFHNRRFPPNSVIFDSTNTTKSDAPNSKEPHQAVKEIKMQPPKRLIEEDLFKSVTVNDDDSVFDD